MTHGTTDGHTTTRTGTDRTGMTITIGITTMTHGITGTITAGILPLRIRGKRCTTGHVEVQGHPVQGRIPDQGLPGQGVLYYQAIRLPAPGLQLYQGHLLKCQGHHPCQGLPEVRPAMFHVAAVRLTGQDRAVPEYQEDRQQAYQDRLRATAEARPQAHQAGAAATLRGLHQAQAGHHPVTAEARHQDPQAGAAAILQAPHHQVQAGHHPATAGARHQDPQAGAAATLQVPHHQVQAVAAAIPEEVQAGAAEAAIPVAAAAVPEAEDKGIYWSTNGAMAPSDAGV